MKIIFSFFICLTTLSINLSQAQNGAKPEFKDTTYTKAWKTWNGTAYVKSDESVYHYDPKGYLIHAMDRKWDGDSLVNVFQETSTFDAKGNLLEERTEKWKNHAWVKHQNVYWTYNEKGGTTSEFLKFWNGKMFVNQYKCKSVLDVNNRETEQIMVVWKETDLAQYMDNFNEVKEPVNYNKKIYTYDAKGNEIARSRQGWNGTEWQNVEDYTTNPTMLKEKKSLNYLKGGEKGAWENWELKTWTYDAKGNKASELQQVWENGAWLDYTKAMWTNDAKGKILTLVYQSTNDAGVVANEYQESYTYNSKGRILTMNKQLWKGNVWENNRLGEFTYTPNKK